MSQNISQMCELEQANDDNLVQYLKYLENKKSQIHHELEAIESEVDDLKHQDLILEKEIACTEYSNIKLKKEILSLKQKAEHDAKAKEKIKWDIYKTELLIEFEKEQNKQINQQISESKQHQNSFNSGTNENDSKSEIDILEEKCKELEKQIDERKKIIQMRDPKLYNEIQLLEKRNNALHLRYKRQVEEAKSRRRQANYELEGLQKILEEKNTLLLKLI